MVSYFNIIILYARPEHDDGLLIVRVEQIQSRSFTNTVRRYTTFAEWPNMDVLPIVL